MKGFVRDNPSFSLCGLNCALCALHVGGHCPGCGGGAGNQSCAIARCGMQRGVAYCSRCGAYPCARYAGMDEHDSFVSTLNRARDLRRMEEMGEAAYTAQLAERTAAYRALAQGYDDGRRKTLFRQAANLLPIEDVRTALARLDAQAGGEKACKARAAYAANMLQEMAAQRGISLKLRRKPPRRAEKAQPGGEDDGGGRAQG